MMLGWNKNLINKIERKAIQSEIEDDLLRLVKYYPLEALELFEHNSSSLSVDDKIRIENIIINALDSLHG